MICFLRFKSNAAAARNDILNTHIAHLDLDVSTIPTDGRSDLAEPFQPLLDTRHNGLVVRARGLLRDIMVALVRGVTEGSTGRQGEEAR